MDGGIITGITAAIEPFPDTKPAAVQPATEELERLRAKVKVALAAWYAGSASAVTEAMILLQTEVDGR